ncbi:MAG: hypothetical protein PVH19_15850 [Planctomycetia bacterium]
MRSTNMAALEKNRVRAGLTTPCVSRFHPYSLGCRVDDMPIDFGRPVAGRTDPPAEGVTGWWI